MAFDCPHCGFKSNEIQSGARVQDLGMEQRVYVSNRQDLNRQLVKSESASVKFVELDFEIPAATQRGVLTTIEGLVSKAANDLDELQPQRKLIDETIHDKLALIIAQLRAYISDPASNPFTLVLDDPAGNSYIESLAAVPGGASGSGGDQALTFRKYQRTKEMCEALCLASEEEQAAGGGGGGGEMVVEDDKEDDDFKVHVFHGNCSRCNAPSDTRMRILDIPHFKEVVIMATDCESCGYKSNEVKAGGAISAKGKRITLKIEGDEDLSRDILKSETCGLSIPEIDLELTSGTLGGRFTTIEGLLTQVRDELAGVGGDSAVNNSGSRFATGDSASDSRKKAFETFLAKLDSAISCKVDGVTRGYTLILDDPLANSYLQNPYAPDDDPNMSVELYERTFDQNEFLGLNDMVLEGYEKN